MAVNWPQVEMYGDWKTFAKALTRALQEFEDQLGRAKVVPFAKLRDPSNFRTAFVPDAPNGPTLAFTDGVNWRDVKDGSVIV